jgi:hypothetical protein
MNGLGLKDSQFCNRPLGKESIMCQAHSGAACLASIVGLLLAVAPASAQFRNPQSQPAFSPYLNLNRPGINPVINYYGTVRPQLGYNSSISQLQQQQQTDVSAIQQQQQFNTSNILPPTGHAAGFQTQSRFFLTRGASGSSGSGTGIAAPTQIKGSIR